MALRISAPLLLSLATVGAAAAEPIVISSSVSRAEGAPLLEALPDGGYAALWTAQQGSSYQLILRTLAGDGSVRGVERLVSEQPSDVPSIRYQLATANDGTILVAYTVRAQQAGDATQWGIAVRRYSPIGDPLDAEESWIASRSTTQFLDLDVAPTSGGEWVVVAQEHVPTGDLVVAIHLDASGRSIAESTLPVSGIVGSLRLARNGAGLLAAWIRTTSAGSFVDLLHLDARGRPLGAAEQVVASQGFGSIFHLVLSTTAEGDGELAWSLDPHLPRSYLWEGRIADGGFERTRGVLLDTTGTVWEPPALGVDDAARFVVAWAAVSEVPGEPRSRIFGQAFGSLGWPTALPVVLAEATDARRVGSPAVAMHPDGRHLVAWAFAQPGLTGIAGAVQPLTIGCTASENVLCLNRGRFAVTADWRTIDGQSGAGHARPLTADSGAFWFFGPENLELVAKVLDGCEYPLNHRYWVFVAGLTDVQVDLEVLDTATGEAWRQHNPLGVPFLPIQDTQALRGCP